MFKRKKTRQKQPRLFDQRDRALNKALSIDEARAKGQLRLV